MKASAWREVELIFYSDQKYENPYLDFEGWVEFRHSSGKSLKREMFWDGGNVFKVRFASTESEGEWDWEAHSRLGVSDSEMEGEKGKRGKIEMGFLGGEESERNRFYRHGFLRMSPGKRNLVHADGKPLLMVGDTAWALPWRATEEQCLKYAEDRQRKGFNTVLLMVVQSDKDAKGPRDRAQPEGFGVAFEDLPEGHLNEINTDYFKELDQLISILVNHELVPVYQPVFHGYGWKGLRAAGPVIPDLEYARFCRYLVARYGARPAMYLSSGDGPGEYSNVHAGGEAFHEFDCYEQPTGNHYCPYATNRAHQEKEWLDFQWCQTGHGGEFFPERVMDMWRNQPVKAVANGEVTYENIGQMGKASGWWQGHAAWSNIFAGGTMGCVYGAGSLWNWVLKDEPGHQDWCKAEDASWEEALDFEGSVFPGQIARIFDAYDFTDMEPNWTLTAGKRGLLVPGKFYAVYLSVGGYVGGINSEIPRRFRVYDPKNGKVVKEGVLGEEKMIHTETSEPRLIIFSSFP